MAELLWDLCPDEHSCLGRGDLPAELVEAFDEDVAAAAVDVADFGDAVLRPLQREDAGDLDGREGAVVEVAFEAGEGVHEDGVADHEADAPAGHVVALGEGEELDGDVFGAGDLKDAGGLVAVEGDVGVGEIVDEVEAVLAGELDEAREKGQLDALGGRVRREVDDQRLGARGHAWDQVFELREEGLLVVDGDADDVGSRNDGAVDVDGVAGVGDQDGVARVEDGEAEMGDALFGADGDDGLAVGVEIDVVAGLVPVADGLAQAGDALGDGVAMGDGLLRGLNHLVNDVFGRGAVGVAHAEVDDVFSAAARGDLHLPGDVKDVRREALNTAELFHDDSSVKGRRD